MEEKMTILTKPKNGKVEIGFKNKELTIANALIEYAQMLCDIYNKKLLLENLKSHELDYKPMCPYGYTDCVGDCNYIKHNYPNRYKKIGSPTKCKNCEDGSEYDNEDK